MGQFDALSDIEFEDFVADLMSKVTGLDYVAGTRGGDRGIDALGVVDGKRHVIQCAHFVRSDFSKLKRKAGREAKRLSELEEPFASYRFVTSMELAHTQRDALVEILEPWVGSRDNVLGGKELVSDLADHSAVATHHPKLWFHGAGQLRRQLSADQYERRSALLEEIRPRLPRFVETGAFEAARDLVRENRVCIIDGPPGVGKTTLAQLLLVDALEDGYEPFQLVRGELAKAWALLELDERQVFYFDDFLGRGELHEARDDEEDLLRFVRRVAGDARRRFVLATRDYIFTEARRASDLLYREIDDSHLFYLTPERYTRLERARILYNHLHFSPQLDARAKGSLVASERHLEVIDHENFKPRLIEWITGFAGRLKAEQLAKYSYFCIRSMSRSEDLWAGPFEEDLDDRQRALLFAFLGLPDGVGAENLEAALLHACASRGLEASEDLLPRVLEGMEGVFVGSVESGDFRSFSLLNPSLLDFLERQILTSRADTEATLRGAHFYEQVQWLWEAWRRDGKLPPEHLWPAFDEALSRVLASKPVEDSWMARAFGPADFHGTFGSRLSEILDRCDQPWFRDAFSAWLPAYAGRWLGELGEERAIYSREVELFERLLEHGMLDRASAGEEMKAHVAALEPSADRWRHLHALRDVVPGVLPVEEMAREASGLEEFLDWALEDPQEFSESDASYGTEGLDELLEVAVAWGIKPDPARVDSARDTLAWLQQEEDQEEEDYEAEMEAIAQADREFLRAESEAEPAAEQDDRAGREDDEIEAIFARLLDDDEDGEALTE